MTYIYKCIVFLCVCKEHESENSNSRFMVLIQPWVQTLEKLKIAHLRNYCAHTFDVNCVCVLCGTGRQLFVSCMMYVFQITKYSQRKFITIVRSHKSRELIDAPVHTEP